MRRYLIKALRLLPLALGAALLTFVIRQLGVHQIGVMLARLRWTFLPVLAIYAAHQTARAAALCFCVTRRHALRFRDALWIRLAGEAVEFLTFTGPLLSEPTKGWLLQQRGHDRATGLACTLTEYFSSTVVASMTAVVGTAYVLAALRPIGPVRGVAIGVLISMSVFAALAVLAVAMRRPLIGPLVRAFMRRPTPNLDTIEETLMQTAHDAPRRLLVILSLELVAQACLGFELRTLLCGLGLPCAFVGSALMEGTMKFMNAGAFFIPAQVGVAEGSYALIFGLFGLPAAAGAAIGLARHLRSLATALAGLVVLVALRCKSRRADGPRVAGGAAMTPTGC